jgi:hypothetical protein
VGGVLAGAGGAGGAGGTLHDDASRLAGNIRIRIRIRILVCILVLVSRLWTAPRVDGPAEGILAHCRIRRVSLYRVAWEAEMNTGDCCRPSINCAMRRRERYAGNGMNCFVSACRPSGSFCSRAKTGRRNDHDGRSEGHAGCGQRAADGLGGMDGGPCGETRW